VVDSGLARGVDRSLRALSKGVFATADLFVGAWPGPRILIYHQITDRPTREMDISPGAFAAQVQWMAEHGRVVGLEEALIDPDHVGGSSDFVLTFDDGYFGLFEHALPLLLDRGWKFTLYLTSQMIDSGDHEGTLNWDQVNRMQETGLLTIGAHTHTHPDLRELSTAQVEEEVGVSNVKIEQSTGVRPEHFAYTKGYWSSVAEPVIRREYRTATLGAGPPIRNDSDPHRLSRVPVQRSDGLFFFKRKVARGMRLEEWTRSRLKGYENPAAASRSASTRGP
jgi:peptidoglycan/xylan/chitin deacetylase (PgdA/CDA1 family)